jgi:hypothetical protein
VRGAGPGRAHSRADRRRRRSRGHAQAPPPRRPGQGRARRLAGAGLQPTPAARCQAAAERGPGRQHPERPGGQGRPGLRLHGARPAGGRDQLPARERAGRLLAAGAHHAALLGPRALGAGQAAPARRARPSWAATNPRPAMRW